MNAFIFLLFIFIDIYLFILLLRLGMEWMNAQYYSPIGLFIDKATRSLVVPINKILPTIHRFNFAVLFLTYLFCLLKCFILLSFSFGSGKIFYLALLSLIKETGYFIFWLVIIRVIFSWIGRGNPAETIIYQLTEPVLSPIRKILPNFGIIDISPMILLIALTFLNRLAIDIFGIIWQVL